MKRRVEQTPPGFEFTVKASRYMTHKWRLQETERLAERFYEPLHPAPRRSRPDGSDAVAATGQLPGATTNGWPARCRPCLPGGTAFEFRHESWFPCTDVLASMLRDAGAALVVGDHPERTFQTHEPTTDWSVVRFHRGRRGRSGNYSATELDEWAQRIDGWRPRGGDVYAYFNNEAEGDFARANARGLKERLGA